MGSRDTPVLHCPKSPEKELTQINKAETAAADFKSPQWPVSWWMLVAFVIGLGFGLVLNTLTNTRLRLDARRAKKIVAESQRALDQSRSQLVENSQPNTSASV